MLSLTQYGLLTALLLGFVIVEFVLGRAQHFNARVGDNTLDMLGFALLAVLTQPLIL